MCRPSHLFNGCRFRAETAFALGGTSGASTAAWSLFRYRLTRTIRGASTGLPEEPAGSEATTSREGSAESMANLRPNGGNLKPSQRITCQINKWDEPRDENESVQSSPKPRRRAQNNTNTMKQKCTPFFQRDQQVASRQEEQRLNSHVKNMNLAQSVSKTMCRSKKFGAATGKLVSDGIKTLPAGPQTM